MSSTEDILIPSNPLDRVLGQEEAIALAKIAAKQRRHLLLVGPPGTGKSMIARAISMQLPKVKTEIRSQTTPRILKGLSSKYLQRKRSTGEHSTLRSIR